MVSPETLEEKETEDHQVYLDLRDHQGHQVLENQVRLVDQVSLAREVRRVRREHQEFLCRGHLEGLEHQDHKVFLDLQVPQEPPVLPKAV